MKLSTAVAFLGVLVAMTPTHAAKISSILYDQKGAQVGDFSYDSDAVALSFNNSSAPGYQGGLYQTPFEMRLFGVTIPANELYINYFNATPGSNYTGAQFNISGSYSYDTYTYIHNIYPIYLGTITTNFQVSVGLPAEPQIGASALPSSVIGLGTAYIDVKSTNAGYQSFNRYVQIAAVPEPASWALMIGGMGFAGGMLRRERPSRVTYA